MCINLWTWVIYQLEQECTAGNGFWCSKALYSCVRSILWYTIRWEWHPNYSRLHESVWWKCKLVTKYFVSYNVTRSSTKKNSSHLHPFQIWNETKLHFFFKFTIILNVADGSDGTDVAPFFQKNFCQNELKFCAELLQ